ncbi:MAG TPA: cyanophycinase [Candidatus Acidoferrum sp.]|nr:cyanophycinase [Candidatus Acidoferrum sp.]
MKPRLFTSFVVLVIALVSARFACASKAYSYFRVGSPNDITTTTTPGTVLMGGGTDVDAAFQRMCQRSGGGDFLVIRATGTDAYNPYIQQLCPAENSVATLIIPNRAAASDPFVASTIQNAEALFIAGGNQADYINFWKGTPVESSLNSLIARGVPVGGTSAGMNVLTEFIYSALASQGVTSSQALADPFTRYITLDRDFVNVVPVQGLIGDPHFVTRDRMGRDLAFLCRIFTNGWSSAPRGISIDEQTALLIDANSNGTVVGSSTVYFLQAPGAPQVCQAKTPLTYQNIAVYRIDSTGSFNLSTWQGTAGVSYTVSANAGVLSSTQSGGSIY